mgnify:CR=1 FL=1
MCLQSVRGNKCDELLFMCFDNGHVLLLTFGKLWDLIGKMVVRYRVDRAR